jgi:diguanylate cyclase (GGDEF)-like protein
MGGAVKNPLDDTTALLRGLEPKRTTPPSAPRLVMIAGPDLGLRVDVAEGQLTIGRDSSCDVVLPLGGVSRVHCAIRREASGLWLRDHGSTNGTRRNGELVRAHDDVRLETGDLIAVGGAMFKLLDADGPEAEYHDRVFRTMALDGLTQLRNRRSLQDAIESEIARSRRHQHALSLLLVDVDRFKDVNDQHGHLAGDLVLQRVAALLAKHGRRENCTARFGGDEFAIVCAETGLAGATVFAQRIRGAVEHEEILVGGVPIEVTISVGVAEWKPQMRQPEDLIAMADAALYRAKHAGRNRVAS